MYCSALALHETWHLQLNKDRHTYTKGKLQSGPDGFAYIELHSHCVWFHKQRTSGYNLCLSLLVTLSPFTGLHTTNSIFNGIK